MLTSMMMSVMTSFAPCGNDLISLYIDNTIEDDYIIETTSSIKISFDGDAISPAIFTYMFSKYFS